MGLGARSLPIAAVVLGLACTGQTEGSAQRSARGDPRGEVQADAPPSSVSAPPTSPIATLPESRDANDAPRRRDATRSHRACRRDLEACVHAAVALTRTDLQRAASLFEVACTEGSAAACGNLAVMLRDGRGIEADAVRANTLMRRACDGGHVPSCPLPSG